jgi:hypothetical protein
MKNTGVRHMALSDISKYMKSHANEYKTSEPWEKFEPWNVTACSIDNEETTKLNSMLGIKSINHTSKKKIKHLNNLWKKKLK